MQILVSWWRRLEGIEARKIDQKTLPEEIRKAIRRALVARKVRNFGGLTSLVVGLSVVPAVETPAHLLPAGVLLSAHASGTVLLAHAYEADVAHIARALKAHLGPSEKATHASLDKNGDVVLIRETKRGMLGRFLKSLPKTHRAPMS